MFGQVYHEAVVRAPANKVWDVYSTAKLGILASKKLPNFVHVDIVEGDGGVGTLSKITFPAGIPGYLERVTRIDNVKRIKETEIVEGGPFELGFLSYRFSHQVVEKNANLSIVKTTIEYKIEKQFICNIEFVTTKPSEIFATLVEGYLTERWSDV